MTGSRRGRRLFEGRSARRIGLGGLLVTAVTLLLVVAPSASASPSPKTLKSPFTGAGYGYEDGYFDGCGGTASFAKSPSFNLTNGHATTIVQANASSCGKGYSTADAYSEAEYDSNSLSLPSGHASIKVRWNTTFSIDLVATPGKRGAADAYVAVLLYGDVYDATNRTYVAETDSYPYYNSTSSGVLTAKITGLSLTEYLNGTFASGHTYYLYLEFELEAYTEVSNKPASAGAFINADTSGNSAKLASIALP
jgi:hypothetical protein